MKLGRRILFSLLAGLSVVRCAEETPTATPISRASGMRILSGNYQSAPVGSLLPDSLKVQVYRSDQSGVAGVVVRFAVRSGSGRLSADSTLTDADGVVSVAWTLGPGAGPMRVAAEASGIQSVVFEATGMPLARPTLTILAGDNQSGEVGLVLPEPLVVQLQDSLGTPLVGQSIVWSVLSGRGLTLSPVVLTNSEGKARVTWFLGYTVGGQSIRASLLGNTLGTTFNATAVFTDGRLSLASGDNQLNGANALLSFPITVSAESPRGDPIAGATVRWAVTSGGGSLSDSTSITNVQGLTAVGWTLGPGNSGQTATATVAGITTASVTFNARSVEAIAGSITGRVTIVPDRIGVSPTSRSPLGFLAQVARSTTDDQARPTRAWSPGPRPIQRPTDRLIVQFKPGAIGAPGGGPSLAAPSVVQRVEDAVRARIAPLAAAGGFELTDVSAVLLSARVQVRQISQIDAIAARLRADPAVASVSRELWYYPLGGPVGGPIGGPINPATTTVAGTIPKDPLYPNQSWHYSMIDLPKAWSMATGSTSVIVAVVDNGIRFDHPALALNLTNDGYDFASSPRPAFLCNGTMLDNAADGDGYDPDPTMPIDYDFDPYGVCLLAPSPLGGHGIHTAGTIGALGNDGIGGTGVNWRVKIRPVRVLGIEGGSNFDVAQGVLYAGGLPASNGRGGTVAPPAAGAARIINMSLGGPCPDPGTADIVHDAVVAASANGSLIIASAGNSSTSEPACPASYPEVISVSALGPDGLPASYTNYGSTVDIAAPGGDFLDGGPDGTFGIFSTTCNFTVSPCQPNYARYSGTSMAAPHVSGVAALLLGAEPGLTSADLRARLLSYAVDEGAPGPDEFYGAGIVNARNSLTQTLAPPTRIFVRLVDTTNGTTVATEQASAFGDFTFSGVPNGSYFVFGGVDENGDGLVGLPGRPWGAYGGTGAPAAVAVSSTVGGTAFFPVGAPGENEGNDDPAHSNRLIVGGFIQGSIPSASDPADVFRVDIVTAGPYAFETSGWNGGYCRFALDLNTVLTLSDANGAVLASNDDIDPQDPAPLVGNRCSRIQAQLTPGRYYVTVTAGLSGLGAVHTGRYRLQARAGT